MLTSDRRVCMKA